jgi:hypothetical protein
MSGVTMDKSALGAAWLVLASVGLAGAAYLFRFESMLSLSGNTMVWDRWHQRACVVVAPMSPAVCSDEDVERLSQASDDLPSAEDVLEPPPQQ